MSAPLVTSPSGYGFLSVAAELQLAKSGVSPLAQKIAHWFFSRCRKRSYETPFSQTRYARETGHHRTSVCRAVAELVAAHIVDEVGVIQWGGHHRSRGAYSKVYDVCSVRIAMLAHGAEWAQDSRRRLCNLAGSALRQRIGPTAVYLHHGATLRQRIDADAAPLPKPKRKKAKQSRTYSSEGVRNKAHPGRAQMSTQSIDPSMKSLDISPPPEPERQAANEAQTQEGRAALMVAAQRNPNFRDTATAARARKHLDAIERKHGLEAGRWLLVGASRDPFWSGWGEASPDWMRRKWWAWLSSLCSTSHAGRLIDEGRAVELEAKRRRDEYAARLRDAERITTPTDDDKRAMQEAMGAWRAKMASAKPARAMFALDRR